MSDLSRRQLLGGLAALGAGALAPRPAYAMASARNLVIVLAFGGWDSMRLFDPKPGIAGVTMAPGKLVWFDDLPLWMPHGQGVWLAPHRFFQRFSHDVQIINGINVRSIAHVDCLRRMLTGTTIHDAPDMGAIVGQVLGADRPVPYLLLGERGLPGRLAHIAGRAGLTGQLQTLVEPGAGHPPYDPSPPAHADAIDAFVRARATRAGLGGEASLQFLEARDRAAAVRALGDDGPSLVGDSLDGRLDSAVNALVTGFSRSVMVDSGMDWDTHTQAGDQERLFDRLFDSLERFVETMKDTEGEEEGASLFDETLIAVVSEMGRTPRWNSAAGRDHWPYASMMLMGGGVAGGRVIGGTDDHLLGVGVDLTTGLPAEGAEPLAAASVVAGLLAHMGLDASRWLPGVFPLRLPRRGDGSSPVRPGTFDDTAVPYRRWRNPCAPRGDSGDSVTPPFYSGQTGGSGQPPCDSGSDWYPPARRPRARRQAVLLGPDGGVRSSRGRHAMQTTLPRLELEGPAAQAARDPGRPLAPLVDRLSDD